MSALLLSRYAARYQDLWRPLPDAEPFILPDGTGIPVGWLDGATAAEREEKGIVETELPTDVLPGERIVGTMIDQGTNPPQWVHLTEEIPIAELAASKIDEIRRLREAREAAGAVVGGVPIRTDEKSQAKVTGGLKVFDLDPGRADYDWEAQPGLYVKVDRPTLEMIGLATGNLIQACHTRSKDLMAIVNAALAANDREAILSLDVSAGWPPLS